MMRKSTNDVFLLIKSLSATEKGYVKNFLSRNTKGSFNKSVLLFDLIDKQKDYNEHHLLKCASFTSKKVLPELKNNLYQNILKALRLFYDNSSAQHCIKNMLIEIKILYDRGLFEQCVVLLQKAEKIGKELEYFIDWLDIIHWKHRLMTVTSYKGIKEEDDFLLMNITLQDIINKTSTFLQYDLLGGQFFYKLKQDIIIRHKSRSDEIDRFILENSFFQNDNKANSVWAKIYYHNTLGTYYGYSGNEEKGYEHYKQLTDELEKKPEWIKEHGYMYYNVLRNYSITCKQVGKYDEAIQLITKMENIPFMTTSYKNECMADIYCLKISLFNHTGQFHRAIQLEPEIIHLLNGPQSLVMKKEKHLIFYHMCMSFFYLEEYKKSLFWVNKILNEKKVFDDIYNFARIFQLIIFYELRDADLLEYLVKSTQRFLHNKEHLYKLEKVIVDLLNKLLREVPSKSQLIEIFKTFKEKIEEISKDPYEKKALSYFDFISWIDSKIEGMSFSEMVKKRNG